MNALIPVKTAKALLAIAQRSYDLPQRLRTVLILINGKADVASLKKDTSFIALLKKENSLLGDMDAILSELKRAGFIEFAKDPREAAILTAAVQEHYAELSKKNVTLEQLSTQDLAVSKEQPITTKNVKEEPSETAAKAASPEPAFDPRIEKAKRELKAFLQPVMGDDYSLVAAKVANCDTAERFKSILYSLEDIIQNYGSRKAGEKLKTQFKEFY